MKSQDIFGVVLRTIGLLLTIYSCWNLAAAIYYIFLGEQFGAFCFYGIPGFIVGVLLIVLARYIVRLSYPGNKEDSEA